MKPGSGVRVRVGDDAPLCRYTLFHSIVDAFGDALDSFIEGHDLRCVASMVDAGFIETTEYQLVDLAARQKVSLNTV
jgi:hypothetical protein